MSDINYSLYKARVELENQAAKFDWVRARKLIAIFDKLFEGRENYDFRVDFWNVEKPGLYVTRGDITIFFKCYKPC